MPKNKGNRGGSFRGRGRGGNRGSSSRGRGGGGSKSRGGRQNNNNGPGKSNSGRHPLYPTSQGFVYKVQSEYYDPETSEDDFEDDFPVFGQFGTVDDPNFDPDIEILEAKEAKTTKQRKVLDHRALLDSRQQQQKQQQQSWHGDSKTGMIRSSRNNDKVQIRSQTYTKAVTFTRSSTMLNNDDNNQNNHENLVEPEATTERIIIEEADESSSFCFNFSDPNDNIIDEMNDHETSQQDDDDDETPGLGFYFDSNPGPVSFNAFSSSSSNNNNNNNNQQITSRSNNNSKKEKGIQRQKQKQKRKIIKGDDIYLGSSSSSSEEEENNVMMKGQHQQNVIRLDNNHHYNRRDYDDDIEIMRDYIENVRLDDDEEMEALRAFANGTDISAQNYPEVFVVVSSDSDEQEGDSEEEEEEEDMQIITSKEDQIDDDFDTIENGGFDHLSDDESIEEISEQDFRYALEQSINHVPPSLQTGIRNRITRETKREKKLAKKQKRLDQRSSKQTKRDLEGINVQLRKLDKRIRLFILDDQLSSYQLSPMSKFCRRQLHLLATAYKLKSYSFGTGAQRTPVLQKTSDTFLPKDRRYIERFLDEGQNTIDAQSSILRKHRMTDPLPHFNNKPNKKGKQNGGNSKKDKKKKDKSMAHPIENTVVGGNSAPINESNVGHRMLAAMGWKQGDALGAHNEGITAPIEAIVRKKRQGLGS